MRVLHIINSLETGGAEKLLLETLPLFNKDGIKADLAVFDRTNYPFKEKLAALGNCKIIDLSKKHRSVYNPLFVFKIMPLLSKYDLVHVHLFPAQYFTVLAKVLSFSKVKLVFTEHSTNNRRMANPRLIAIERFIYRHYARILCITTQVKESLIRKLGLPERQLEIVENGINLQEISDAEPSNRSTFSYSTKDCLLIMVAGFRKEKDQDTVIKALGKLPANFHLILVGDGPRKDDLINLVTSLKLTSRVRFLGIRSDVYQLIKMADIAVLSSHWEGFGLAAAEAMAAGTPVIAANVAGLSQVVDGGGILFEKGNENELITHILNVATNSDLQKKLSVMGIKKSERYNITNLIDQSVQLYKAVLNSPT